MNMAEKRPHFKWKGGSLVTGDTKMPKWIIVVGGKKIGQLSKLFQMFVLVSTMHL